MTTLQMRRQALHAVIVTVLAMLPSSVAFAQGSLASLPRQSATPTVRPGDKIIVEVFRKPELSGDLNVTIDGRVGHPVYRDVAVVGLSRSAVDAVIGERVRAIEGNSPFVVDVLHRVSIGGNVRSPGFHFVRGDATIYQALTQAGGATEQADVSRLVVTRDGMRAVVDVGSGDTLVTHFRVQSGDEITVPRRRQSFVTYVAPVASVIAVIVSVANLLTR